MDKSWINIRNLLDPLYEKESDDFVVFASKDRPNATEILCPCMKCCNMRFVKKVDVAEHIVVDGFLEIYTHWIFHGKSSLTSSSIPEPFVGDITQEMKHDAFTVPIFNQLDGIGSEGGNEDGDGLDDAIKMFFNLIKKAKKELYPGCKKYSTLSFLILLLNIKCLSAMSDKVFTILLNLLKDAFPRGKTLPKSLYEARKIIGNLGLDYKKIHACPNDSMIYWKDTAYERKCIHCHTPRYK
ncbi:hypothetical protein RJ639_009806 [Escallonia herrerae]|uniref:Transposase-associated domain-containing protein n=1 Tax=Escallonia herrerae TaxID=1293975 RepID=A0AA88VYC3_9ASTE|nr:hypothetical protein RJ639_009806 [Escallonia herrerae]